MTHTPARTLSICLAVIIAGSASAEEPIPKARVLQTRDGVSFALLGDKPKTPAATLFVFALDMQGTLNGDAYNKIGRLLFKDGFLSVALDIPCHGADLRDGEKAGNLAGWRTRLEKGDDLLGGLSKRVSTVLDHLIKEGYTDEKRVAAAGTSRGGFVAMHMAVAEPRIRAVVAFAPVTDLLAIREFAGMDKHEPTRALSLLNHADKLAGRALWLCIGNQDERVSTDQSIALTRKVVAASTARKTPIIPVDLHVIGTVGHSIHATAHDEAAAWLRTQLK